MKAIQSLTPTTVSHASKHITRTLIVKAKCSLCPRVIDVEDFTNCEFCGATNYCEAHTCLCTPLAQSIRAAKFARENLPASYATILRLEARAKVSPLTKLEKFQLKASIGFADKCEAFLKGYAVQVGLA